MRILILFWSYSSLADCPYPLALIKPVGIINHPMSPHRRAPAAASLTEGAWSTSSRATLLTIWWATNCWAVGRSTTRWEREQHAHSRSPADGLESCGKRGDRYRTLSEAYIEWRDTLCHRKRRERNPCMTEHLFQERQIGAILWTRPLQSLLLFRFSYRG